MIVCQWAIIRTDNALHVADKQLTQIEQLRRANKAANASFVKK
jgi:hypothetical protein